jgi:hypothetical protein
MHIGSKNVAFTQNRDDLNNEDLASYKQEPILDANRWNHICISFEKESGQMSLYLNGRDSFISQELELAGSIFKDKMLVLGKRGTITITEFRFWKLKFSINEVRDGYKTPLAIVAEKKKSFKMRFKEKNTVDQEPKDLKKFTGFLQLENPFAQAEPEHKLEEPAPMQF